MRLVTAVLILSLVITLPGPAPAQQGRFEHPDFAGMGPVDSARATAFLGAIVRPVPRGIVDRIRRARPGARSALETPLPVKGRALRMEALDGQRPGLDPSSDYRRFLGARSGELTAIEERASRDPRTAAHVKGYRDAVLIEAGNLSPEARINHVLHAADALIRQREAREGRRLTDEERAEIYVDLKLLTLRMMALAEQGAVYDLVKLGSLSTTYNFPQEFPGGLDLTRRYNQGQVIEYVLRTDSSLSVDGKVRVAYDFKANLLQGVVAADLAQTGDPAYAGIKAALLANRILSPSGSATLPDSSGRPRRLRLPGSAGDPAGSESHQGALFTARLAEEVLFQTVTPEGETYHFEGEAPVPDTLAVLPNPFAIMPARTLTREKEVWWSKPYTELDHEGLSGHKAKITFVDVERRGGGFFSRRGFKVARLDGEVHTADLRPVGTFESYVDVRSGVVTEERIAIDAKTRLPDGNRARLVIDVVMELGRVVKPGPNPDLVPRPVE